MSVYVTNFLQNRCFFYFSSSCCTSNCERAITSLRPFPSQFRVRTILNSKTIKMFHVNCQKKKTPKTSKSIKGKENKITLKRFIDIFNRLAKAPLFARFGYLSNNRQSAYTRYEMNCWHTNKKEIKKKAEPQRDDFHATKWRHFKLYINKCTFTATASDNSWLL